MFICMSDAKKSVKRKQLLLRLEFSAISYRQLVILRYSYTLQMMKDVTFLDGCRVDLEAVDFAGSSGG